MLPQGLSRSETALHRSGWAAWVKKPWEEAGLRSLCVHTVKQPLPGPLSPLLHPHAPLNGPLLCAPPAEGVWKTFTALTPGSHLAEPGCTDGKLYGTGRSLDYVVHSCLFCSHEG